MLEEVKGYLRIDGIDLDNELLSYIESAKIYIKQTTGKAFDGADELYKLCIKMLVAHWYENKGATVVGTIVVNLPLTVDTLIKHIATCGDYA